MRRSARAAAVVVLVAGCGSAAKNGGALLTSAVRTPTHGSTDTTTSVPSALTASPTPLSAPPYPPMTFAEFQDFYGHNLGAPYTQIRNEQVGALQCDQRRIVIVVPKADTPQAVAAALANAYVDSRMGSGVIFAYYSASEAATSDVYTAGRLKRDTPCSDSANTLEIDTGDPTSAASAVITAGLPPGPGAP